MAFNFKSKLWGGNIFHQFESICQDVDGFVNKKETANFVGNQVQSVGMSVKRLYSNVVKDMLPLYGDIAKPQQQLAAGEQVDSQDCVSITGIRTTFANADEMQLAKNQGSDDHKMQIFTPADVPEAQPCQHLREQGNAMAVQNSKDSSSSAEKNVKDLKPVTANSSFDSAISSGNLSEFHEEGSTSIEKERRDFDHKKEDEAFSESDEDVSSSPEFSAHEELYQGDDSSSIAEKNVTKDLKPVIANSSFDSEIFSGNSPEVSAHEEGSTSIEKERRDFDHQRGDEGISESDEDVSSSPEFSAHEEGSGSIEKERRDFDHKKGDEGFSDDTMCPSDTSSFAWLSKSKLPMVEDPYSDENGSLSSPPVPVSTHIVNHESFPLMDSPLPPSCDGDDWALEKYGTLSENCSFKDDYVDLSTSIQSSEHVFSFHSCNKKEEQMAIMLSTSCTSPKSSISMESSSADFSKEAENVLHSRSVSDGYTCNVSATSSINTADKTKEVDVEPAFLIIESNDNNEFQTGWSEFVIGSSESGHEEHYKNSHSKIVISPSETENTYGLGIPIGDLDMEAVDLSSNVKHDGRSVVLYSNLVVPGSYRRRNFRYYKKLIQGAFTSRKRLSKEYEHLAIMYGDIDMESNQHFEQNPLSSFSNTTLQAEKTHSSSQEMSENEWELL